jgi:hypothetical protein
VSDGLSGDQQPKMLSTGVPSTLGNWYALCKAVFGTESPATTFIKEKLDEQGADMEVLADERQMLIVLIDLHLPTQPTEGEPS